MSAKKDFYTVTHEEAAELLNVSMRTLDRYLKNGKLRNKLSPSRNVLINEQDLSKMAGKLISAKPVASKKQAKPKKVNHPTAETVNVESTVVEEKIFRDLYEDANRDLKQKQEKLEAASFRVGQLEAQLKNSVPLLEHKQKEEELFGENARLKEKLVAAILKSWVFLGVAGVAAIAAGALAFFVYL